MRNSAQDFGKRVAESTSYWISTLAMMETPVVVDCVQNIPRRLEFTHRWGARIRYKIDLGINTVLVRTPLVRNCRHAKQFEFQLPGGDNISATYDNPPAITIRANDDVVAEFVPTLHLNAAEIEGRAKHRQVATVWIGEQCLPLVCSVFCEYFPHDHRILSAAGSRMCYWRKTAGWSAQNAILLISKRVEKSFFPVAISAALVSLLLDGTGD